MLIISDISGKAQEAGYKEFKFRKLVKSFGGEAWSLTKTYLRNIKNLIFFDISLFVS